MHADEIEVRVDEGRIVFRVGDGTMRLTPEKARFLAGYIEGSRPEHTGIHPGAAWIEVNVGGHLGERHVTMTAPIPPDRARTLPEELRAAADAAANA